MGAPSKQTKKWKQKDLKLEGLLMVSNGFSIIAGHSFFWPEVKPKANLRISGHLKNQKPVFQIRPLQKVRFKWTTFKGGKDFFMSQVPL